ncbi:MAG TPA: ABC transporter substrate-binding protein [Alphaproteobacteria bacterium]|jgi:branched-chain amino acid transport system substrate-binding protein|nr:ABC transporter substrate-binding protein [Alphaproteobacteria bacterium]
MNVQRLTVGVVAVLAATLLAVPVRAQQTYDIHVVQPLTGGGSFLGKAEQQSLQLAEKVANANGGIQGRPLKFIFHDDQSNPQTAVQLANEVIATKPAVMIGSSLVAMCNAIAPLMQNGPVQYCLSPGIHPKEGSYTFTSSTSTHDLAIALVRYFRLRGWTKIATMTSTDASGQDAENNLKNVVQMPENKDVKIVEAGHFNTTDVSVTAQIERIKAANPDVLIAWSTGTPIATIFRGIIQAGLDIPVATTDGNMTYAQMNQYANFLPKQLFIPAAQWVTGYSPEVELPEAEKAKQKEFFDAFKAANIQPDVASELAWDPAMILIDALRKLGPSATAAQVREYISKLKGFVGANGTYDFVKTPQRGLEVDNVVVTRWSPSLKHWEVMSKPTGVPLDNKK